MMSLAGDQSVGEKVVTRWRCWSAERTLCGERRLVDELVTAAGGWMGSLLITEKMKFSIVMSCSRWSALLELAVS